MTNTRLYRDEHRLRADIVEVGRRMHRQGLTVAADGNLSVRLGPEHILITPSGLSKGYLSPDELLIIDMEGEVVPSYRPAQRGLKPSSETPMHLEVYRQRPDVGAVIHAHPPMSIACTIAGISLARCILPEIICVLGKIPTASFALPSSPEGAGAIRPLIVDHDAVLLDHHGTITVGDDIFLALMRLEQVEHAARITVTAHQLGQVRVLSRDAVDALAEMRRRAQRAKGRDVCATCDVCEWGGRG
jgi:L-fuculose-phosphate aldolase